MTTTNTTPVATVNDHSLHVDQWTTVASWMNVSDGDNDTITKYQFWDSGASATSGYFWTPTNTHWAADTTIDVSAADLADTWVRGGSATGSETLWVRAFDGTQWGAWDTFTLTTTINTVPLATINDQSPPIPVQRPSPPGLSQPRHVRVTGLHPSMPSQCTPGQCRSATH